MKNKPTIKDWIFATRPWSFPASSMPALVSFMYVFYLSRITPMPVDWLNGILAIIGVIIFHISGNVISDYYDYKKGVDREDTFGFRLLVNQTFQPNTILKYGISFLVLAILLGFYLYSRSGTPLLIIGGLGAIASIFYFQFKSRALGDFLIFIIYGPSITVGTYYAMTSTLSWNSLLISLPLAFITTDILHANNTRDILHDKRANIKTWAMQIGVKASVLEYKALLCAAYVSLISLVITGVLHWLTLAALLTFPLAWNNWKMMGSVSNNDELSNISNLDIKTAQLQLMFSLLYAVSIFISDWL